MLSDKTLARIVGVLFIVASASAIIGGSLLLPLTETDFIAETAANEAQIVSGVLIEWILVLSVIGIAVMIHPVLKRRDEGLALAYVGARTLEAVLLLAASMSALVILTLSRDFGGTGASGVDAVGSSLLAARDWTYLIGSMVALGVSALLLNSLLFQAKLVPSWLSIWGLLGGGLILLRGVVEAYGTEFSGPVQALIAGPIAIQEMVLAIWLIVRGFDTTEPRATEDPMVALDVVEPV